MAASPLRVYVALLRGINVGGKNVLPMKSLTAIFEAAGCADVKTYIQSGNVVFRAEAAPVSTLADRAARAIEKKHHLVVPVVLRSAGELRRVANANPFLASDPTTDPSSLHVAFLASRPSASAVASLDANRSPPDAFTVRGPEIYLRLPNGVARTRLTNSWFDSRLGTTSTVRNWRTVLTLAAMCAELGDG